MDENVEYEEREDEFDIVSGTLSGLRVSLLTTWCVLQEDEAEIARRKMLEEEEDVDIEAIYTLEVLEFIALDVEDRGLALGLPLGLYDILLPRECP